MREAYFWYKNLQVNQLKPHNNNNLSHIVGKQYNQIVFFESANNCQILSVNDINKDYGVHDTIFEPLDVPSHVDEIHVSLKF